MAVRTPSRTTGDTKARILDAAEDIFIECGYEAMSLRQITSRADVNLAAVNYHFGSKEALIHAMLARRLDTLNVERLKLLDRFEAQLADRLTCEHVLGAMFIPALRLSRDPRAGGPAFLRLLGRAYTDPSAFIHDFLNGHYADVAERFFDAFQHALPHLPREELGWRLHFAIGALSGVLAGADTDNLIAEFSKGQAISDLHLIARLASLMVAALKAPLPDGTQLAAFAAVLGDAGDSCDAAAAIGECGPLVAPAPHDEAQGEVKPEEHAGAPVAGAHALQAAGAHAGQQQEGVRPAL
ncbi:MULTISPECIES: TetR/AcrR family transcriptional regulator [unclassified Trinickia]|jgi:AcrR family transcriptional regulator|uniref:TetR/AcrR family transcriptional regulator n=1 Tax=unclassified Trinickia TaxID=2638168 RepID=UPI0024064D48|nr:MULTISPECIES: TetR/AcrR family transcriptional regulator [unclassified Trinickia]MDG0022859.1 TetR/AcrR family transcriptional regulator [Trinickia sp. Y13]HVW51122.1 TetR/AcrR family transcriptional regulator [Trinickia sp.]